jgi:hypothetical protein
MISPDSNHFFPTNWAIPLTFDKNAMDKPKPQQAKKKIINPKICYLPC